MDGAVSIGVEHRLTDPARWSEQYGEYLLRYALCYVKDLHAAQDVVQETWLAAWQARTRFAGHSSERSWLAGILRHKAIDHVRSARRERLLSDGQGPHLDLTGSQTCTLRSSQRQTTWMDPLQQLEKKQLMKAVDRCLRLFPSRMRIVTTLCDLEEIPHREVARRLGITDNHLYVLLHRARGRLRQCVARLNNSGAPLESAVRETSHVPRRSSRGNCAEQQEAACA